MISIPALSGDECVRALRRGGFEVLLVENGITQLVRASRAVCVPREACLSEESVREILGVAGVPLTEFLDLLSSGSSFPRLVAAREAREGGHG
jgi:hypothetical protein